MTVTSLKTATVFNGRPFSLCVAAVHDRVCRTDPFVKVAAVSAAAGSTVPKVRNINAHVVCRGHGNVPRTCQYTARDVSTGIDEKFRRFAGLADRPFHNAYPVGQGPKGWRPAPQVTMGGTCGDVGAEL